MCGLTNAAVPWFEIRRIQVIEALDPMRPTKVNSHNYINLPTQQLLDSVEEYISHHSELSQHPNVREAFHSLETVSERVPSFVSYVTERLHLPLDCGGLNAGEIIQLEMFMLTRVLSTYPSIPLLVGQLHLCGEYGAAAQINSNAMDESGGKGKSSHHELLISSLNIIAKHLGGLPVTTKLMVAAIQIYELKHKSARKKISDQELLWDQLLREGHYVPISQEELPTAVELAGLLNDDMLRYHRHVHKTLLQPSLYKTSDRRMLALATLELAKREAESVDEKEANLSFIGAWEEIVHFYKNQLSPDEYAKALAWSAAHNDEKEAKKAGWQDRSAEDGHARDARDVALHFLKALNPTEFVQVIEQVTENARLRLQHWDHLVAALRQIRSSFDYEVHPQPALHTT
jgi:PIN domain nuclease of toxin-antitoxin system